MRLFSIALVTAGFLLVTPGDLAVGRMPPSPQEITCPVGGEKFVHFGYSGRYVSYSNPDGSSEGDASGADNLPECPKNGLVVFKEFSEAELERLPSILAARDFFELPRHQQFDLLIAATWDQDRRRREKYMRKLAAVSDSPENASPDTPDDFWVRLIFVNAWRETGQFDGAMRRLKALPIERLNVLIPDAVYGPEEVFGGEKFRPVVNRDAISAATDKLAIHGYAKRMEVVVARRDPSRFLLELLPFKQASWFCRDMGVPELSKANRQFCAEPAMTAEVRRLRVVAAQEEEESRAWMRERCAQSKQQPGTPVSAIDAAAEAALDAVGLGCPPQ
jgi:hypothetical protein